MNLGNLRAQRNAAVNRSTYLASNSWSFPPPDTEEISIFQRERDGNAEYASDDLVL